MFWLAVKTAIFTLAGFGILEGLVYAADEAAPLDIINYADKITGIAVLIVIAYGAIKQWWVPGREYRRIVQERDRLLDLVLKSQEVGQRALETVEKVIKT